MKIIVGLIQHESNSFNPNLTSLNEFNLLVGKEILKNKKLYESSSLEGIINVLHKHEVDIIPTILASTTSEGGLVAKDAYREIKKIFLEQIKIKQGDFDGICLAFHGSMTVEGGEDAEGDLLKSIREIIGKDVPIVCALDMHAMVTEKMLVNADAFVSYRTAPHVDQIATGEKAAEILYDSLINNYKLYTAAIELPILVSGEKSESDKPPMNELFNEIRNSDKKSGILASSYCLGFPWVDVEFNSGAALVVTKNDSDLAKKEVKKLAEKFMKKLPDFKFTTETYSFKETIEIAQNEKEGPIFIIDSGDNPGAGGSQDITCTLDYLLSLKVKKILYAVIVDFDAYQICAEAGDNNQVLVNIGKKDDNISAKPLRIKGKIKKIGRYKDLNAAVIAIQGLDLIITNKKIVLTDPEFFFSLGLDFKNYKIVILKSGYLDPKLKPYTKRVLLGLSPGYTNQVLENLHYEKIKRPIYPFDDISNLKLKYINKD